MMSPANLTQFLANSIVVMVFGSNDYINNYLMPNLYATSRFYNPQAFSNVLLNRYAHQLQALYSLGLRKFFLAGVGPIGCTPNQLATGQGAPGRCVDSVNQMVGPFNEGLRRLVGQFNGGSHPGAMFVYGNTYGTFGDILNNPARYGFRVRDRACCGLGRNQGQITCIPNLMPCANRNEYVFWDAFHPTQAANGVLAQRAYSGSTTDTFPINVQQLAQLKL
ncbi:putative triacylglycerol lipase [Helianthus anomalus]